MSLFSHVMPVSSLPGFKFFLYLDFFEFLFYDPDVMLGIGFCLDVFCGGGIILKGFFEFSGLAFVIGGYDTGAGVIGVFFEDFIRGDVSFICASKINKGLRPKEHDFYVIRIKFKRPVKI